MAGEVKTVTDMKVGDKLLLGRFAAQWSVAPNDEMFRISWLKATKENDFISEHVLMNGVYDPASWVAGVRRVCESFRESNLCTFLNSEEDQWFKPAYDWDMHEPYTNMGKHAGFLKYFEAEEIDALMSDGVTGTGQRYLVRIPTEDEVLYHGFQLFRRKGVRAHPSASYCSFHHTPASSYPAYWTMTQCPNGYDRRHCVCVGSDAYTKIKNTSQTYGIRPVCAIKHNTKVVQIDAKTYEIDVSNGIYVPSDEDLLGMLGIL